MYEYPRSVVPRPSRFSSENKLETLSLKEKELSVFKEWGIEVPPIGTTCKLSCDVGNTKNYVPQGTEVQIIAHFKAYPHLDTQLIAAFLYKQEGGAQVVAQGVASCFEKIKTAEEIAAENKERLLVNLLANYGVELYASHNRMIQKKLLDSLYDAGYIVKD